MYIDYNTIVDKCESYNSKDDDWARRYAKDGHKETLDDNSTVYYCYKENVDSTYVLVIQDNVTCQYYSFNTNEVHEELQTYFKNNLE